MKKPKSDKPPLTPEQILVKKLEKEIEAKNRELASLSARINELTPLTRLSRDLQAAAATLGVREARFLVDLYYGVQKYRIASGEQIRSLSKSVEPHETLLWVLAQTQLLEDQIKKALDRWSGTTPQGRWAKSIHGIAGVLAAGLGAHIDAAACSTAGAVWRFAGLDPTRIWPGREKAGELVKAASGAVSHKGNLRDIAAIVASQIGARTETILKWASTDNKGKPVKLTLETITRAIARRPWNASLKMLCWKIGESFVKFSNSEECYYGQLWATYKREKWEADKRGEFAADADKVAARLRADRDSETKYWVTGCMTPEMVRQWEATPANEKLGLVQKIAGAPGTGIKMLSPGHIHARSRRYIVKLFLSHYHHVAYKAKHGVPPPKPYVIEHLGHVHYVAPPSWEE